MRLTARADDAEAAARAARRRGGRGAGGPRRPRVRRRRRADGGRGRPPARGRRAARSARRRVAHRRAGGVAASSTVPGSSDWFRGGVVAYDSRGEVRPARRARGPGRHARRRRWRWPTACARLLGADVGLATTGVAGPAEQEGQPPGHGLARAWPSATTSTAVHVQLPGDRDRVRQFTVISLMDRLRRQLLARANREAKRRGGGRDRPADAGVGPVPHDARQLGDERVDRHGRRGRRHRRSPGSRPRSPSTRWSWRRS